MHGVIRASVPLMELAADRCAALSPHDPVAGPLREYLQQHIAEERDHDDWLLADLSAVRPGFQDGLAEQPAPVVASLVGAQYYWIRHHHPVSLLGYIAVMEGNAPSRSLADWILSCTGAPEAAVRTVRAHADLDTGHTQAVFELLDALPLTRAQTRAVATSGLYTADALIRVFTHICGHRNDPARVAAPSDPREPDHA
jgi:hypothetical protein